MQILQIDVRLVPVSQTRYLSNQIQIKIVLLKISELYTNLLFSHPYLSVISFQIDFINFPFCFATYLLLSYARIIFSTLIHYYFLTYLFLFSNVLNFITFVYVFPNNVRLRFSKFHWIYRFPNSIIFTVIFDFFQNVQLLYFRFPFITCTYIYLIPL